MLFLPPRHGKSEATTIRYPVWRLETNRTLRICVGCYNSRFAERFGRKARRIAERRFPLARDRSAAAEWETPEGGVYRTCGVGSPPTGEGFDLLILDDPVKSREEAESEAYRERCWEWYRTDLYTRLEPAASVVLIMTRWQEDDLAGRILASESAAGWDVVNLPAIAGPDDPLGRQEGEALCPDRYDLAALEDIRRTLGTYSFEALYQQRPSPSEGGFFKRAWFLTTYAELPELVEVWTTCDTSLKAAERNDEGAIFTAGRGADGNLYPLHLEHGHWETPDAAKRLVANAERWKARYGERYRGDYVEDKVSGTTLIQYLRRSHPHLALIPVQVDADKDARAKGTTPFCEAGRVIFPDLAKFPECRGWVEYLLHQLLIFPNGALDDCVDAFVYSLKRMMGTLRVKGWTGRSKTGGFV